MPETFNSALPGEQQSIRRGAWVDALPEPGSVVVRVGDSASLLRDLAPESVDCVITSPPYWGHRDYSAGGIGQEPTVQGYVEALLSVFEPLQKALKPTGSFWLNLGDTYRSKRLQGIPWRVAIAMVDEQDWILRNDVIWNKVKGSPDNAKDKLRNLHEHIFHFVKDPKKAYYDVDAIRRPPRAATERNGKVQSATGVSGTRYRRQIELSTVLSETEKVAAMSALDEMMQSVKAGEISDFRMVIRGVHRVTHSDSVRLSGRAKELADRGFYFLKYHPKGAKPSDIWEIIPEDTHGREAHYAAYPEALCEIPIQATCPPDGLVLDPFLGTGTTLVVAKRLGRRALGIDISKEYAAIAEARIKEVA